MIASTLLCPLEATRIRLVTEPDFAGEVFDALLRLLIFLPGMVGVVQVCLWQTYKLHGVALGMYPTEVD